MRLIEGDKLQEFPIRANRCDKEHANEHFINGIETVLAYAEQLPTVDAVVVTRCKDCKKSGVTEFGKRYCKEPMGSFYGCIPVEDDYFCSGGRRREEQ